MYSLSDLWLRALNKKADQTFFVNGMAITAFNIKYEGNMMWLLLSNSDKPDLPECLLSPDEYETFRYINEDVPFLDW